MEYYWAIKRDKIQTHAMTWMTFEDYMKWTEKNTEGHILQGFTYKKCSRMGKSVGIKCRLAAAKGWKEGEKELTDNGHRVSLGVVNMFCNGDGCTTLWIYSKPINCIPGACSKSPRREDGWRKRLGLSRGLASTCQSCFATHRQVTGSGQWDVRGFLFWVFWESLVSF